MAIWAAGLSGAAFAADPIRGQGLYATPPRAGMLACADCHSEDPWVNNFGNIFVGRNAPALIQRAINGNTGGMVVFSAFYGEAELTDIAAYLGNSPTRLSFPVVAVGEASTAQRIVVHASSKIGLSDLAASIEPGSDFRILDGGCPGAINARESCHFDLSFTPTTTGPRSASLFIAHSGTPTPVQIRLEGSAIARPTGIAVIRPRAAAFGEAGARRVVTVSNGGQDLLVLKTLSASPADFAIDGGSCTPGRPLRAGQWCTVALAFAPLAPGARSGELRVEHDGIGGSAVVALAGSVSALGLPRVAIDASYLDFGAQLPGTASPTRMLSVANAGGGSLQWAQIATTSDAFRIEASSCAPTQGAAPGVPCQLAVVFEPSRAVPFSGELVLTPAGAGATRRIPVHGQGVADGGHLVATRPRVALRGLPGSVSAVQHVHLVNRGTQGLTVRDVAVSGAQATEFILDPTGGCRSGAWLHPGASCVLALRFAPLAAGQRSARVVVSHDAAPDTATVDLLGSTGVEPSLWMDTTALVFRDQVADAADDRDQRSVVLRNPSESPLTLRAMAVTGEQAADFPLTTSCPLPGQLGPGAACEARLRFAPRTAGQRRASLLIDTGTASRSLVGLAGVARAAPAPALMLSLLAMDFGSQALAASPPPRRLRLANEGSAPIRVTTLGVDGPFALDQAAACQRSLAPGEACSVGVAFVPTATGSVTGSLSVRADGAVAPRVVALAGRAVEIAATLGWVDGDALRWTAPMAVGQTSDAQALTLVNHGNAPAAVTITTEGGAAMDFSLDPASSCLGATLAPGAACKARMLFHPSSAGPRSARLIASSDGRTHVEATLDAQGVAPAAGRLEVGPVAVAWAADPLRASMMQRLVIGNAGAGELTVQALGVLNPAFVVATSAGTGCAMDGFVLLPGDSCEVELGWTGSAQASAGGSLQVLTDDAAGLLVVPLAITEDPQIRSNVGVGGGALGPATLLLLAAAVILLAWRRPKSHT